MLLCLCVEAHFLDYAHDEYKKKGQTGNKMYGRDVTNYLEKERNV